MKYIVGDVVTCMGRTCEVVEIASGCDNGLLIRGVVDDDGMWLRSGDRTKMLVLDAMCDRVAVNWDAPIEAYHPDGRVVGVERDQEMPQRECRWIRENTDIDSRDGSRAMCFEINGEHLNSDWRIRNVISTPDRVRHGGTIWMDEPIVDNNPNYGLRANNDTPSADDLLRRIAVDGDSPYQADAAALVGDVPDEAVDRAYDLWLSRWSSNRETVPGLHDIWRAGVAWARGQ